MIKIIAAVGKNYELGKDNSLMWNLKEDMKFFRTTTAGNTVIMGRLTYESIGRPLPKRRNIVITSQGGEYPDGIELASSLDEALNMCNRDCFVIGGASVYSQCLDKADEIYLTEIGKSYPDADVYFPQFDKSKFSLDILGEVSEDGISYRFAKYTRGDLK